jgi:serine-type D-Ala-D-Ala carboxypeptidase/endopeptidase (penicillin-binding protein 4)
MISKLFSRGMLLAIILPAASEPPPSATHPESSLIDWQRQIRSHLDQPRFSAAAWGVEVISLDSGKTLFEHHSRKLLKPASNAKLFTAAAVLDQFGPDFRIKTSYYGTNRPNAQGVLNGPLRIYGRGDPSLSFRFESNSRALFDPAISALAKLGITKIEGPLLGDESFFRGHSLGSSWTWQDLQYAYGAPVSSLNATDNLIDFILSPANRPGEPCALILSPPLPFLTFENRTRTVPPDADRFIQLFRAPGAAHVILSGQLPAGGANWNSSVPVHDPALWHLTLFREALLQTGIEVSAQLQTISSSSSTADTDQSNWIELASVESPPLSELLAHTLKPSQNLYAQLLLLQLGAAEPPLTTDQDQTVPIQTTERLGVIALEKFLHKAGIDSKQVLLDEGSGLSRSALLTPRATVELLRFMHAHPHANAFKESLPIAGRDGTLQSRLKGTVAEGAVFAKTGTLRYVHALAGYIKTVAGEQLAFALMLNNYDAPSAAARLDLDTIVLILTELPKD